MRETEREKNVSGEESKASNRQECQMRVGAQLSPSQDGLKGESQRERERETEGEVTGLPMTPNLYLKLPQQCRPDTDTFTSWPHVLSAATSSPKTKQNKKK